MGDESIYNIGISQLNETTAELEILPGVGNLSHGPTWLTHQPLKDGIRDFSP